MQAVSAVDFFPQGIKVDVFLWTFCPSYRTLCFVKQLFRYYGRMVLRDFYPLALILQPDKITPHFPRFTLTDNICPGIPLIVKYIQD